MSTDRSKSDVADYVTDKTEDPDRRRAARPRCVDDTFRSTALGCAGEPVLEMDDDEEGLKTEETSQGSSIGRPAAKKVQRQVEDDEATDRTLMRMGGNGF